jgi:uncharacterized lipoprotein YajG
MKNYIIFILSLILLSSCAEDPNAYKVEEELDIYAQDSSPMQKNMVIISTTKD